MRWPWGRRRDKTARIESPAAAEPSETAPTPQAHGRLWIGFSDGSGMPVDPESGSGRALLAAARRLVR